MEEEILEEEFMQERLIEQKQINSEKTQDTRCSSMINNSMDKLHLQTDPYIDEITSYVLENQTTYLILQNYITWHEEINILMRQQLVGWIISIHNKLQLNEITLHLTIHLIDRFCYLKYISKNRYQLLGITALFISAKFQEVKTPRFKDYLYFCAGAYQYSHLVQMEGQILQTLGFQIQGLLTYWLLEARLEKLQKNQHIRGLCNYLLNLTLIQYEFCTLRPNYLSGVIIYMAYKLDDTIRLKSKSLINRYNLNQDIFKAYFYKINALWNNRYRIKYYFVTNKFKQLSYQFFQSQNIKRK